MRRDFQSTVRDMVPEFQTLIQAPAPQLAAVRRLWRFLICLTSLHFRLP